MCLAALLKKISFLAGRWRGHHGVAVLPVQGDAMVWMGASLPIVGVVARVEIELLRHAFK